MRASSEQLTALGAGATPGQEYLSSTLGRTNPHLEDVINSLGSDISRFAQREIGSGVAGAAAGTGGAFGSSRHGISEGLVGEQAMRSFSDAAGQLRYGDYASQAARAEALINSQRAGAIGQAAIAPAAYNLGIAPWTAQWLPLQQYAMTLGRPTVLSEGRSESDGFNISL